MPDRSSKNGMRALFDNRVYEDTTDDKQPGHMTREATVIDNISERSAVRDDDGNGNGGTRIRNTQNRFVT